MWKKQEIVPIFLQKTLLSHFEPPTKQQERWERGIKRRCYELGFDMQNYYLFNKTNQFTGFFSIQNIA
jgi:hypothetical protein